MTSDYWASINKESQKLFVGFISHLSYCSQDEISEFVSLHGAIDFHSSTHKIEKDLERMKQIVERLKARKNG